MLYLNRKPLEVIHIQNNSDGSVIELVPLEVIRRYNRYSGSYEHVIRLGFVDDSKNYTFLRKEVKMRQDGSPNPNPFFKDEVPSWYKSKEQLEAERSTPPTEESTTSVEQILEVVEKL